MTVNPAPPLLVGREREQAVVARVLDDDGPRVCFIYGIPGIGKSALLAGFRNSCASAGVPVFAVDCGAIDPTPAAFLDALADAGWEPVGAEEGGVVVVDTYEVFRIADPWLRHELLPSLPANMRIVVASRDAPMLEWSVDRGRLGGLQVLPLGPLDDGAVHALLEAVGVQDIDVADSIVRTVRGHPLAVRLAAEAGVAQVPPEQTLPRVIDALASAFRDGLNAETREILDAASVPRRVTQGVMAAMLGDRAEPALAVLAGMSFVDVTAEGLRLHDAVHAAVAARLRSLHPDRFRELRGAAWRHLRAETMLAGMSELRRTTADLLFLIDNAFVREAMFPTTSHAYSVEPSTPADAPALRELWRAHDTEEGAAALDAWLELRPRAVRAVRDRTGVVVGCSIVAEWRDIPSALERVDPVVAAWSRHGARNPLPPGQRTLVHRRVLSTDAGEGPSAAQAAAWLDLKGDYFGMRPRAGRLYTGIRDPQPFLGALLTLGFQPFDEPIQLGGEPFHLAALDFGPASIDGWLGRVAAAELGIADTPFLDADNRTARAGGREVRLSPLEFRALEALSARRGTALTRVDLLQEVWGSAYDGGSNNVDVLIRNLRKKLGPDAALVETVRGVGYRLR